jgi:LysM repeat protein
MFGITPVTGYAVILKNTLLPVPPSSISVNCNGRNETVDLLNGQQINLLKNPALEEISFDFLLPHIKYPFVKIAELKSITYYLNMLSELGASKKPFLYMVSRNLPDGTSLFPTVLTVSLEGWSYKEDASYGNDIVVSVTLKRYEYYETKKLYVEETTATDNGTQEAVEVSVESTETREDDRELEQYYTVQKGDTLWKICKDYFDDGSRYKEIAELNGISNPNKIYVGQKIKMYESVEASVTTGVVNVTSAVGKLY